MNPRPSNLRHEQTRSPNVLYSTMSRHSLEEHEQLERRRAKRKKRDDDEMYKGMRNSNLLQRGWNGELESDRQETIRGFHEAEHAKARAQVAKERTASEASRPPVVTERVSLRQLKEGSERVQTRHTLEAIALEDTADRMTEEATSSMLSRHINMDDIIREAQISGTNKDRRIRSSAPQVDRSIDTAEGRRRSLPQGNGPNERERRSSELPKRIEPPSRDRSEQQHVSSEGPECIESPSPSPPTSSADQQRGHQRAPSEAGSLKENERETECPAGVRRPVDQLRGFGNDITAWVEEERKLQEAKATAQEAIAANRREPMLSTRRILLPTGYQPLLSMRRLILQHGRPLLPTDVHKTAMAVLDIDVLEKLRHKKMLNDGLASFDIGR